MVRGTSLPSNLNFFLTKLQGRCFMGKGGGPKVQSLFGIQSVFGAGFKDCMGGVLEKGAPAQQPKASSLSQNAPGPCPSRAKSCSKLRGPSQGQRVRVASLSPFSCLVLHFILTSTQSAAVNPAGRPIVEALQCVSLVPPSLAAQTDPCLSFD